MTSLKKHCARYSIPRMIVSDGGPQFISPEFKLFEENWGTSHITSSPMHQRANRARDKVMICLTQPQFHIL